MLVDQDLAVQTIHISCTIRTMKWHPFFMWMIKSRSIETEDLSHLFFHSLFRCQSVKSVRRWSTSLLQFLINSHNPRKNNGHLEQMSRYGRESTHFLWTDDGWTGTIRSGTIAEIRFVEPRTHSQMHYSHTITVAICLLRAPSDIGRKKRRNKLPAIRETVLYSTKRRTTDHDNNCEGFARASFPDPSSSDQLISIRQEANCGKKWLVNSNPMKKRSSQWNWQWVW